MTEQIDQEQSDLVRNWLMKKPRPSAVRITDVAGEVRDYPIPAKPRWRSIANDVLLMEPTLLECLNMEGDLLRPLRFQREAPADEKTTSREPVSLDIPDQLLTGQFGPMAMLMTHFANLIHRSYEHSTNIAFDKLIAVFERLESRTESMERRLEESEDRYRDEVYDRMNELLDEAEKKAEENGGGKEEILNTLFQSMGRGRRAHRGGKSGNGVWQD